MACRIRRRVSRVVLEMMATSLLLAGVGCPGETGGTDAVTGDPGPGDVEDATDLAPDPGGPPDTAPDVPPPPPPPDGTRLIFELDGNWSTPESFFDFPWPSDLRLTADGTPDMGALPGVGDNVLVAGLLETALQRPGFPTIPVAWFRFDGPPAPRALTELIPAAVDSPVLLLDIDPDSPARDRLYPTVAMTMEPDPYVPENVLGVAPWPGFVLVPGRLHAFVVMRSANAADGAPLGVPEELWQLAHGNTPEAALGASAAGLYAPLWETLRELGVDPAEVAAATVFTPGDVVAALAELSSAVIAEHQATISPLAVDADDGADHPRFCELVGTITLPQFQVGEPPFDTEGLFELGADGVPILQGSVTVPLVVTVPKSEMPAEGYPLVLYMHGSGGIASQLVDRGPIPFAGAPPTKGEGPAHVLAGHGFASASHALPVNPERVPGATSIEYLNFANLKSFRDIFRQGVFELRMLLSALLELEIDPKLLSSCPEATLPAGADAFRFDQEPVGATGQSMGGMYTNMFGAVEDRVKVVVPTGAGGFWSYMILVTDLLDAPPLLKIALETSAELTFMHPALHTMQTAWEPAEPMVYMPRLASRPLPGHPIRPVYEPAGQGDSYFPTILYDAYVLAYDHQMAGEEVWPSMQQAMALAGLDGILDYPVTDNRSSLDGAPFTGVVVQYPGDGFTDPHAIYAQYEEVMHQYGCFLESFFATGRASVVAPASLTTPCPATP